MKAHAIAVGMGGGVKDFFWALEADPYQVDVLYYICNRAESAKALSNVPLAEQPSSDVLRNYEQIYTPEASPAWNELFPKLALWLSDYAYRQKKQAQEEADSKPGPGSNASSFNFDRG